MTGHDLYPPSPEAREFIETAEILAEPYNETIAELRAKLAAAEHERDDQTWRADVAEALCTAAKRDKERAEAALVAVRATATNLFNQIGFAGVQAIAEMAGRALAAAEQDEPKRCEHGQSGPHHWNPEGTYSNGPGAGCPGPVEPKPCVHAVCSCTMGALPRCPEPTPEQP